MGGLDLQNHHLGMPLKKLIMSLFQFQLNVRGLKNEKKNYIFCLLKFRVFFFFCGICSVTLVNGEEPFTIFRCSLGSKVQSSNHQTLCGHQLFFYPVVITIRFHSIFS